MSDVMNQQEIDALLNALNRGELDVNEIKKEEEKVEIKVYDFRRPNKFSKEHLRTLQMIFDEFSRSAATFLSGYLRTMVQIDVISAEQLTYYEFNNSITNSMILGIVDFSPLNGSIIIGFYSNTAYSLIDRILGGSGQGDYNSKNFTEIELILMEQIIRELVSYLKEPWSNFLDLKPSLQKIETNTQFAQIAAANETVALFTMNIKIGKNEGYMIICIPHMVIEPIIPKLSTRFWYSTPNTQTGKQDMKNIEKRLESTYVTLIGVLGKAELKIADILNLSPGDVIQLNNSVTSGVDVYVENKKMFKGIPGKNRGKLAVKVLGQYEGGEHGV
ncbi:flagellar motor switch protein FliM [Calorimonas adulescens]|jgi:flagellar motor switch protein FliM|uniref:Flagellar motor switch protein FliM n=1 Tax=Calorimonas adulescens TaxID=2606906 RepID=A0A5D8QFH6_9THEO|nr:flagellar motor switch protein FliM [Calorimonas adulescens]TZE83345.1 flagellar motor switch protein FliM [Calorimonas adulescens]